MKKGFSTRAIHSGKRPDLTTGAITPPIYATSTYVQESPGRHKGYEYSRSQNLTRESYEKCIADLEGGAEGFAFSSGLAAETACLELLDSGSHVIAQDDMYGGTYRLMENLKKRSANLSFSFVDMSDRNAIEKAIQKNTKMIWIETPSNPLLKIVDLSMIADIAKKNGLLSAVDSTFATPYLQRPLEFGFDIVIHSTTKYINGHSDIIGGMIVTGDDKNLREQFRFLQNSMGGIPSPFDCFLAHRGVKTLSLRMDRHCSNAFAIAEWLETQPQIEKVIYPGLKSHPAYETAKKQMSAFGGMITFILKGTIENSRKFLENCSVFSLAESLGGVESLIEHPAIMTHASVPPEIRKELGISDGLIRVSVGLEDKDDLINDFKNALKECGL
ncbi:MAG TPA: PLP-dependent aspartate aminotransferase family protein [Leptospiraceae bacterium]|nr:PLP-dependent aspartate aminotransferase family protein [Leptospiraceae bacterium]HMY65553.1 PLP-dependent aspartate aminotransferase family protein [Leptospiraceae bacterium]HNM02913.1 PLP-dependent aspartate aminotransferase family protein [Leptospiraceae bacterium]HNN02258.1 PLP-dependent aspartate aminotransferase family protein [Leptospiraceae bacterium]